MVSTAITSVAILKVNWDTLGKDYIENFVPFVMQCIISLKSQVVSIDDVQTKMLGDFGLRVPRNALRVILNRAAKKGYITRQAGAYVPNQDTLEKLDFESTRQRVLREHNATIGKLIQFCANTYKVSWLKDDAEVAILSYIAKHQVEILRSSIDGTPIPQVPGPDRRADFLVNAFIIHLYENDPEGFSYLDTIVKGSMLANVLLYPDISRVESKFERTELYCDTAFLIRAVGLEGAVQQAPCKELLDLLYEKGAELRCFRHTLDEIRGILYACMNGLRPGSFPGGPGRTIRYLFYAGYKASDVELELAGLERKLARFRIKVADKPEYVPKFQIDEGALAQALEQQIGYGERERARDHDVDCLSAIYRLRKGHDYYLLENCVAMFLTTNTPLVQVCHRFFTQESSVSGLAVPMAITDHLLTTILWLKKPMSAPNLPSKHIIADCYAAMEPGDNLWRKYLAEISRLQSRGDISSDEYYLLRASLSARTELMNLTIGDEDFFAESTPKEILERIKQTIKDEESAKVVEERTRREQAERALADTTFKLEANIRAEEAREQERQKQLAHINLKIEGFAQRVARWLAWAPYSLFVVMLLIGAYTAFPWNFENIGSNWWGYLLSGALVVFISVSFLDLVFGVSVKAYSRHFEVFLSRFIERKLKGWFSP